MAGYSLIKDASYLYARLKSFIKHAFMLNDILKESGTTAG